MTFTNGDKVQLIDDMPEDCDGPLFVYYVGKHPTREGYSIIMWPNEYFYMEETASLRFYGVSNSTKDITQ